MYLQTLWIAFGSFILIYSIYRRLTRISISHIRGPKSDSFLYGLLPVIYRGNAAAMDFEWYKQFGKVFRIPGPLGHDRLMLSDPKALQYIFHTHAYRFLRDRELHPITVLMAGNGVVTAEGNVHKRQRAVMRPGFGAPETRAFMPIFEHFSSKLTTKWKDLISVSSDQTAVVDVHRWLSRATMDSLGAAAFDYQFDCMEDADNVLSKSYQNLFLDTLQLSPPTVLFMVLAKYLPYGLLRAITLINPRTNHARDTYQLSMKVAKELLDEKAAGVLDEESNKDMMSLLVKANASADSKVKLTEEELLGQLQTLIIAGHDTTANSLSWALYELSRHPDMQSRLRDEIREVKQAISQRGDDNFTALDFDNMPYLAAVAKETLRFHPVVYNLTRQAAHDDVLPLLESIVTENGKVIHEIPIPKGQKIVASIATYNRLPEVFGEDADEFNPDRWLKDSKKSTSLGVFSNLFTFSGGTRACLGWRFAVLELQAFLVELVGSFEFYPTKESGKIVRAAVSLMSPLVEDEEEKGTQLPLKIRVASEGN